MQTSAKAVGRHLSAVSTTDAAGNKVFCFSFVSVLPAQPTHHCATADLYKLELPIPIACRYSILYARMSNGRNLNVNFEVPVIAQDRVSLKLANLGLNRQAGAGKGGDKPGAGVCLALNFPCATLDTFCWPQNGLC
ncbi:uncharacterized protein HaLaN_22339, partial [Haematococcus lacustris]